MPKAGGAFLASYCPPDLKLKRTVRTERTVFPGIREEPSVNRQRLHFGGMLCPYQMEKKPCQVAHTTWRQTHSVDDLEIRNLLLQWIDFVKSAPANAKRWQKEMNNVNLNADLI